MLNKYLASQLPGHKISKTTHCCVHKLFKVTRASKQLPAWLHPKITKICNASSAWTI